ncbi:MAG TPA: NAD(P)/FAD-dependent oxidoreductase [Solirubrobacterales bacterium]|nr:NAD(P)/FAD-dependent oxidoreductase [Solirubrobacterales bacterium]
MNQSRYDVAIAGASLAGCAAARLFAQTGARVVLVERQPELDAYKVTCTHAIQPSASGAIERLGLAPLLDRAGAVRIRPALWTPYGGWVQFTSDGPTGYGITRRRLDPMLRRLAIETDGVDYLPGQTVVGLLGDGERAAGLVTEARDGTRTELPARLTVAADGRYSTVARLAGVRARILPNKRFAYFAYWRGVRPRTDEARIWFLEPDGAAVFPNEDGLTLIAVIAHDPRLPEFRADLEGEYHRIIDGLADGPDLGAAQRESKLMGKLSMPNKFRPAGGRGLAFVGDAALAADPLFGVGCGWAFQTAEWLVERTAPALNDRGALDRALRRYRHTILRRLGPHHLQMSDYSTGRRMRLDERTVIRAATRDRVVGAAFEEVGTRQRQPLRMLDPRLLPRLVRYGRPSS